MSASTHDTLFSLDVNVSHMSEEEVLQFESVLNRNDAVNAMEINRIRRLKTSVPHSQQTRSSLSSPSSVQPVRAFQNIVCQRCGSLCLLPTAVMTRSSMSVTCVCRICRSLLCRTCWGTSPSGNRLRICASCYQRIVMDAKTGLWFHQQIKKRLSNQASLQLESDTPDSCPDQHSPKRNLLRRLRSYSSVNEDLFDGDQRENNDNRYSDSDRMDSMGVISGHRLSQYESGICPMFHINPESADDPKDETRIDGCRVQSSRHYYRPLSHINTNPLKSSSNGSPVPGDETNIDHWPQVTIEDRCDNNNVVVATSPVTGLTGTETGDVLIELDFNFRMSQFIVILRQCRNLPVADPCTKSICPYLFLLLLPDRSKKSRRTTSVKKNSFNPTYDQIFKYSINFTELETRSLLVMLCHKDDHSTRDLALGQVVVSLGFIDFSKPVVRWYPFQLLAHLTGQPRYERSLSAAVTTNKRTSIPPYLGEISLALKYVPRQSINVMTLTQTDSIGELHVWVKSMRHLASHQWTSSPSPAPMAGRRFSSNDGTAAQTVPGIARNGLTLSSSRLLTAVTQLGQSPPVARVCLLPYRTNVQTTEPARAQCDNGTQFTWSAILKFPNVDIDELRTRSMEVTVWVNCRHGWLNKIIQSKCMGGVRLSRGCSSPDPASTVNSRGASTGLIEERMWNAMLERANTWVDGTAKLKMDPSFLVQASSQ